MGRLEHPTDGHGFAEIPGATQLGALGHQGYYGPRCTANHYEWVLWALDVDKLPDTEGGRRENVTDSLRRRGFCRVAHVPELSRCLESALAVSLSVFSLRAFPLLVAFFASTGATLRQKLVALAIYLSVLAPAVRYFQFGADTLAAAYAYLLLLSTAVFFTRISGLRFALFPFALVGFLIVPSLALPQLAIIGLLGWDLAMSVYSYCTDVPVQARDLGRYYFFLFVNPTVAYARCGTKIDEAGFHAQGLRRASIGLTAIAMSGALGAVRLPGLSAWPDLGKLAAVGLRVSSVYAAHWGLASLQLGLFRQLGYHAPERYLSPFGARSPRDFWARWNTYLGTWVRIYVFTPVVRALHSRSRSGGLRRAGVRFAALLVSFALVGALHDLYVWTVTHRAAIAGTLWFSANALVVAVWELAAPSRFRWGGRFASRAAMLGTIAALALLFP